MLTKATVVGAGAMGLVASQVLAANNVHVALLARRQSAVDEMLARREHRRYLPGMRLDDRITPTTDARGALLSTELVISAVPCQHLDAAWRPLAAFTPRDAIVCSVTKGLEVSTLRRPTEILASMLPHNPLAVLSGPSIAPEVARCLPATVVVASEDAQIAEQIQVAMSTSWFRVYTNPDPLGVEFAGAIKNIVALAAGILDGLSAGDNAKAALLTRGLAEMTRLCVALGAQPETLFGLAGVGDLVTTCFSPVGRNRSAGERVGAGASAEEVQRESNSVIEGIPTTQAVVRLAREHHVEMPITNAVYDVLFNQKPPLEAITELMNRPLRSEERV